MHCAEDHKHRGRCWNQGRDRNRSVKVQLVESGVKKGDLTGGNADITAAKAVEKNIGAEFRSVWAAVGLARIRVSGW